MIESPCRVWGEVVSMFYAEELQVELLYLEARKLGVQLILLGYLPRAELVNLSRLAHYLVVPSNSEGFGQVAIESGACGTRVLVPKALHLAREANVRTSQNSVLIDGADELSIQKTIRDLSQPPNDREGVFVSVRHFARGKVALKYLEVFRKVGTS